MSFGYSISDITLSVRLIGTAVSALKETGGAFSEFHDLHHYLSDLQHILQVLEAAQGKPEFRNFDGLDRIAARAKDLRTRISTFLDQINKYEDALGQSSKWNHAVPRKLR